MTVWLALALCVTAAVVVLLWRRRAVRPITAKNASYDPAPASNAPSFDAKFDAKKDAPIVPFQTDATINVASSVYLLSFGVPRFDYQILGPHQLVLQSATEAVAHVVGEQRYFPRKPVLLPKLLRALNSGDSTREEIVRLILQDPVLAGNVLKRANSVYYRQSSAPVESIDRAVVMLGNEGLRAPVATAVMQPVFRLPRGFFDHFAPLTWELAQRTALSAETYARLHKTSDSFVAHLLGLLGGLGRIVLFQMTLDKYRKHNILPRAEVFISLMKAHEQQVTKMVASAWELTPAFIAAIDAQIEQTLPQQMTPLARTLYYANLCGALALLVSKNKFTTEQAHELLKAQGLDSESVASMWLIASDNTQA